MKRSILTFSRSAIRSLDQQAAARYGIPEIVLMENAARGVAHAAASYCGGNGYICVVCGGGNNGADGLAAARHLANAGFRVSVLVARVPAEGTSGATHLAICRAMKIRRVRSLPRKVDLIVDALFGTGLTRAPEGAEARLIGAMNRHGAAILAVDIPSGLDADTGSAAGAAVRADLTVTFVGPKRGMLTPLGAGYCGDILIADIGAPVQLARALGKAIVLPGD